MKKDLKYINKESKNGKKKLALIILILLWLLFVLLNNAENKSNLISQETEISDLNSPAIILDEDNVYEMEVNCEIPSILAIAEDNKDTNPQISVNTSNINPNEVGTYTVTITATDDNGNTTTKDIIFEVVDTIAPTIILNGNNPIYHQVNTKYVDPGVTVTDNNDKTEDIKLEVRNTVNTSALGTYTVTYVATDTAGNISGEIIRTVVVVDRITIVLPKGNVNYSETEITTGAVTVTLTTNKEILTPTGWTKIDETTYVRTYTDNLIEVITITDLSGNTGTVNIKIENIEKDFGILNGDWSRLKGVNKPKVSSDMIPIKWDGSNWIVCSTDDLDWYSYDGTSNKWANIMISDGIYTSNTVAVGQILQESELRKYVCLDTKICI